MSSVKHKYFSPICLLMTKIIIQVSKELKVTSINHNFLFSRHLRRLEGCLVRLQPSSEVMAASKTWQKLKFASKFGNKAELAKEKVEEEEEDYIYKIVKEPEAKYKNIIREYSQIMHFVFFFFKQCLIVRESEF